MESERHRRHGSRAMLAARSITISAGRRLFAPLMRGRATIFMLHRMDDPRLGIIGHSPKFVREAIDALRRSGARLVKLQYLIDCWRAGEPVEPDCVAFTLDDGFADQGRLIEESFLEVQCPVTVFLISGLLDGRLWPWDDQLAHAFRTCTVQRARLELDHNVLDLDLSTASLRKIALSQVRELCKQIPNAGLYEQIGQIAAALGTQIPARAPEQFEPMTWDTASRLERAGVAFGPHSVTHRIFSRLSDAEVRNEIRESWARLRQTLVAPLPVFAWPTGRRSDFRDDHAGIAKAEGLVASLAADEDYASIVADAGEAALYKINRFSLPMDLAGVLRYGSWLQRARQIAMPIRTRPRRLQHRT